MDAIDPTFFLIGGLIIFGLFIFLIFAVAVFFLVRTGLKHRDNVKHRHVEMRELASRLSFSFDEREGLAALPFLVGLEIFEGSPLCLENLMIGSIGDERIAVFDLVYSNIIAGGTGTTTSRQTMCAIESPSLHLPRFNVRPEGILEKALHFAGRGDIDFPKHKAFSDGFLLFGDDEAAIRSVFRTDVIRFFEQNSALAASASGRNLMVFRSRYVARVAEIEGVLRTARTLRGLF